MRRIGLGLLVCLGLMAPAQAQQIVPATQQQIPIAGTVAAITRIVTGIPTKFIYVTSVFLAPVPTAVVTFSYGTGTNCGTGTTALTGAMTFSAGQTLDYGNGFGAIYVVPVGQDLCITIATAAAPGSLTYAIQ